MIHMAWDLCQLPPPRQSLNILSMPHYPISGMQGGRALDLQEVAVVVVMMALVVVAEGGCLPHQHLREWALPHLGITGDGAQVAVST